MYKLTERITIKKFKENIEDENGNSTDFYDEFYSCWASYKALSGKKFAEQQATHYQKLDSFVIRYCKKASELLVEDLEKYQIVFREKVYSIKYPYDIENQHTFIDLECELIE